MTKTFFLDLVLNLATEVNTVCADKANIVLINECEIFTQYLQSAQRYSGKHQYDK